MNVSKTSRISSAKAAAPRAPEVDLLDQYRHAKAQHPDALVFVRLGDFYEMFYDDAPIGARALDIVLTSRPTGKGKERVPLCGVPHHRLESYLARLVEKGYKVAICEQLEAPQKGRKIIDRQVVRVVTPGTLFETSGKERSLAAVVPDKERVGVAFLALATGEFLVAETTAADLPGLLDKMRPQEVVLRAGETRNHSVYAGAFLTERSAKAFSPSAALSVLSETFGPNVIESLKISHRPSLVAAGALLAYVKETQQDFLPHLKSPQTYRGEDFLVLDSQTQRNLELVENILKGTEEGTLFAVLNVTATRMGSRRLRNWLLHPLLSVDDIRRRQDAVEELTEQHRLREELRDALSRILDLERLTSRLTSVVANPRDLAALQASLAPLPNVQEILASFSTSLLSTLHDEFDPLADIHREIQRTMVEEPRALPKEGGLIREGVSAELDELRAMQVDGSGWLAKLEAREREQTQIPNLRVGFNKIFGYYIEVTKSYLHLVPKSYVRRQTLVNAERFLTKELQRFEEQTLSAADRCKQIEYEIFLRLRDHVAAQADRLRQTAGVLGTLDVLASLAEVAVKKGWVKPGISNVYGIHIKEGRHPVVEALAGQFVPNDLDLDEQHHLLLLTGPNAAGKSTFARQSALLILLAQMGGFLPVESATIGVVDRIFTRVGAADFLARGLSTFMVEMMETANILRHATERSLIILDEVGRGTGTSDGQAIAQAVAEALACEIKAKTIFTTHYHELARLADTVPGIVNARLEVREDRDEVTFLYKVVPGAAQESYGLYVAKLAGLPEHIVLRAKELFHGWQKADAVVRRGNEKEILAVAEANGYSVPHAIIAKLVRTDPLHTTPMEALLLVAELKKLAESGGK
ncbi:MAG: DNA mismatch repair protein MutS [Deltaproteobacteria bacterium]|nr:DNA mismatch repair protein MutS [Deltaproteobacteria bacterium]